MPKQIKPQASLGAYTLMWVIFSLLLLVGGLLQHLQGSAKLIGT